MIGRIGPLVGQLVPAKRSSNTGSSKRRNMILPPQFAATFFLLAFGCRITEDPNDNRSKAAPAKPVCARNVTFLELSLGIFLHTICTWDNR